MPPIVAGASIDMGISWDGIVAGVNAFAPVLGMPVILGAGAVISIGVAGMILSMIKRGFGRR